MLEVLIGRCFVERCSTKLFSVVNRCTIQPKKKLRMDKIEMIRNEFPFGNFRCVIDGERRIRHKLNIKPNSFL